MTKFKKLLSVLVCAAMVGAALPCASVGAATTGNTWQTSARVYVDGKEVKFDVYPTVENGTTMVPMRAIFEALGATVTWDNENSTAIGVIDDTTVSIKIGDNMLYKNGTPIELRAPAVIKDGRTLVHVRAIAEAFGAKVDWNGDEMRVDITTDDLLEDGRHITTAFSAPIGEVNGTVYAARKINEHCSMLPVDINHPDCGISEFCCYNGYVYYVETEGATSDYSTWLYRCKPDWSEQELLVGFAYDSSTGYYGCRSFVIDNNVLYYGNYADYAYGDYADYAIDLFTMEKSIGEVPIYTVTYNGTVYDSDDRYSDVEIYVYDDMTFFTKGNSIYIVENGNNRTLATLDSTGIEVLGFADGCLYYSTSNNGNEKLYRVSVSNGMSEFIDSKIVLAGGGGYFNY